MANTGDLNNKLNELAILEKGLWDAYCQSEKEYTPSPLRLVAAFRNTLSLSQNKLLKWYYNYPISLFLAVAFATATLVSEWLLIPYVLFLGFTFLAKEKYARAYAISKLGTQQYTAHAFGIDNVSLAAVGVLKLRGAGGSKLNKESISAIIKIVKASHDHSEVAFGLADIFKKSLYTAPIPVIYSALENWDSVQKYWEIITKAVSNNVIILTVLITMLISLLFLMYDLLVGQTLSKRRKKKYLLLLNIIAESFSTK